MPKTRLYTREFVKSTYEKTKVPKRDIVYVCNDCKDSFKKDFPDAKKMDYITSARCIVCNQKGTCIPFIVIEET